MADKIVTVNRLNLRLLIEFIDNLGESRKSFRYFNNRELTALRNHLVTYLFIRNDKPVGYGHLDQEDKTVWLGVAVLHEFLGMGIGKMIVNKLLRAGKEKKLHEIFLTVDKENHDAIKLYKNVGFYIVDDFRSSKHHKLKLDLN